MNHNQSGDTSMEKILKDLRLQLIQKSNAERSLSEKKFFKEPIDNYGVSVPEVNKLADSFKNKLSDFSKNEIFEICSKLWQSGKLEETLVACNWAYNRRKYFEADDFSTFEHWISHYVSNWASCDTLCNHTVGDFIEMFPQYVANLKMWAISENRWLKRASCVSLILPARKGLFENDILEIADLLLLDPDDLVQKGYGWMLKAGSQHNQKLIFDYVIKHKKIMPRTALRYAIEKMPPELRELAMAK
jgi:3-methyladenine DNA glycosylase AlkD